MMIAYYPLKLYILRNREVSTVLEAWDDFANQVWESYSRAKDLKQLRPARYKSPLQRKWASFNGKFDQFVFFDADSLAIKSVDDVFEKLQKIYK